MAALGVRKYWTDLATDLARTGRLRFGDAADGVLQMRRPIGQRGLLDRQPIDACGLGLMRVLSSSRTPSPLRSSSGTNSTPAFPTQSSRVLPLAFPRRQRENQCCPCSGIEMLRAPVVIFAISLAPTAGHRSRWPMASELSSNRKSDSRLGTG